MKRIFALVALVFGCLLCLTYPRAARAHNIPASHLDIRLYGTSLAITLDAPVSGWAHDLPGLTAQNAVQKQAQIEALIALRLALLADGKPCVMTTGGDAQLLPPERGETPLRIALVAVLPARARMLTVRGQVFPTDPNHHMILTVRGISGGLIHEAVLTPSAAEAVVALGDAGAQSPFAMFAQFVKEGVFHIAIGPDHILFIVALMLMGGTVPQLLKVVTAFTVAHSLTLVLAALGLLRVPSAVVEPMIAASIVFVGMRVLQRKWKRADDAAGKGAEERLPYAFGFGLIHGLGFASALAELQLPRQALAVSLFGFNVGVEVGQAILVLSITPTLAYLHRRYPVFAHRLVLTLAAVVIAAGAYWFGERVAG